MDPWHWGTVSAIGFAVLCEAWHGYCRYASSRMEADFGSEHGFIDSLPFLDRLIVRAEWTGEIVGIGDEGYEEYVGRAWFRHSWYAQAPVIRAVGRLSLVGFVLAGFAARQFSIPWVEIATTTS